MFSIAVRLGLVLLCAACFSAAVRARQSATQQHATQTQQEAPPAKKNERPAAETAAQGEPFDKATVEQMSKQCVTLETEVGAIRIEMLAEAAPETTRNFLNLAATGAFDTTTFSRVVRGFVIQGGTSRRARS